MTSHRAAGSSSPSIPSIPFGNLSVKGIDTTNTSYPVSYERTPVPELPFPHPKWHVWSSTGDIYEVTSPIFKEYDPVTGYVDSVSPTMQSVEHDYQDAKRVWSAIGMGKGNEKETGLGDCGVAGVWTGRVEWPESHDRTSILREMKHATEEARETDVGVRRSKRRKVRG